MGVLRIPFGIVKDHAQGSFANAQGSIGNTQGSFGKTQGSFGNAQDSFGSFERFAQGYIKVQWALSRFLGALCGISMAFFGVHGLFSQRILGADLSKVHAVCL